MRTARQKSNPMTAAFAVSLIIVSIIAGLLAMRIIDTRLPARTTTQSQPTTAAPAFPTPPVTNMGSAPILPTAHIPVVVNEEYQAAPPADVPVESLQPRSEVVTVKRAPEEITITRTIPQNPSGPPIVIDKGQKRRGVPKP